MHWSELHIRLNPSSPNPISEERRKKVTVRENDIHQNVKRKSYRLLSSVIVRQYNRMNYLCLSKQSDMVETSVTIEREDEKSTDNNSVLA